MKNFQLQKIPLRPEEKNDSIRRARYHDVSILKNCLKYFITVEESPIVRPRVKGTSLSDALQQVTTFIARGFRNTLETRAPNSQSRIAY